jgi:UDP-N-acetyl-D-mannosaminuronic acid transferase (WecB/TagA/CpsF family)
VTKIHNIWGINFLLSNLDEYFSYLEKTISEKDKIILTGINPYSLSIIKKNPVMLDALRITTIANVDGILLKYSLQLLGYDVPERLDTPSVFIKLYSIVLRGRFPHVFWWRLIVFKKIGG